MISNTAAIKSQVNGAPGANDTPGNLSFWTTADGANSATQRMSIDSSGNIMFGTTSSTVYDDASGNGVVIRGGVGAVDIMRNADHPLLLNRTGGDGQMCMYHRDGVNKAASALRSGHLCFDLPSGSERVRITSDGDFMVGTTSNASSNGVGVKVNYGSTNPTFNCVINQSAGNHSFYHLYNTNATHNAYRFYVMTNGGIANHSGNNSNLSDERMKKNITDMGSVSVSYTHLTLPTNREV